MSASYQTAVARMYALGHELAQTPSHKFDLGHMRVLLTVLEVGMGGRLDATNVVEPRVSVITDISLDHEKFLGSTIAEIAREKVGIIRPRGVVVTLPQSPQANDVIGNAILEQDACAISAV